MIVFVGAGPLAYLCYQELLNRNLAISLTWTGLGASPDVLISVQYPHRIEDVVLRRFRLCANLHTGLLPDNKGVHTCAAPILRGDQQTGVTLHEMTSAIDEGDIILQSAYPMLPSDTCESLYYKGVFAGVELFKQFLDLLMPYREGRVNPQQIEEVLSMKKSQPSGGYRTLRGSIDFSGPLHEDDPLFERKLRAYFFPQKQFPVVMKEGKRLKLVSMLPERYET
ncbi:MAG TPA: formyltransferase family protein [Blastocatellia bacterium]|nr:formyltransferase family protein [Blastocatellia bacterium]